MLSTMPRVKETDDSSEEGSEPDDAEERRSELDADEDDALRGGAEDEPEHDEDVLLVAETMMMELEAGRSVPAVHEAFRLMRPHYERSETSSTGRAVALSTGIAVNQSLVDASSGLPTKSR